MPVKWKEHLDELRDLAAQGKGVREIAAIFGAKEDAASKALRTYGIKIDQAALLERKRAAMKRVEEQHREKRKQAMKTKQYRFKRSVIAKRLWQDEEYARRRMESWMKVCSNREWIEQHKEKRMAGILRWNQEVKERKLKEAAEQEALDAMTPFERQLWLVRNGRVSIGINHNRRYK